VSDKLLLHPAKPPRRARGAEASSSPGEAASSRARRVGEWIFIMKMEKKIYRFASAALPPRPPLFFVFFICAARGKGAGVRSARAR